MLRPATYLPGRPAGRPSARRLREAPDQEHRVVVEALSDALAVHPKLEYVKARVALPVGKGEERGARGYEVVWLARARDQWPSTLWINPVPENYWRYTQSIAMVQEIFGPDAMVPMTLEGIDRGMRVLG